MAQKNQQRRKDGLLTSTSSLLSIAERLWGSSERDYRWLGRPFLYKNMFCGNCGKKIATDGLFCDFCGISIQKAPKEVPKKSIGISFVPVGLSIVLLLLAIFLDSPDAGFFTFLRWIVMATGIYYAYIFYSKLKQQDYWFWSLVVLAVLFNPIVPIYLEKETWQIIDLLVLVIMAIFIFKLKKVKNV